MYMLSIANPQHGETSWKPNMEYVMNVTSWTIEADAEL